MNTYNGIIVNSDIINLLNPGWKAKKKREKSVEIW